MARGLASGLERSKSGSHLAFLTNVQWKPKHILLASCHAVVEAAALHLVAPHATLLCLTSDNSTRQSHKHGGQSATWKRGLLRLDVRPVKATGLPTHNWEASSDLSISWSPAMQAAIPAVPDMIIVPAEGEGAMQAVGSSLLGSSHMTVSQHLISRLSAESAEELATAPAQGDLLLHMHISGWEVYAREMAVSTVSTEHRTELKGPARGGVKIAYHVSAIGRYSAIVHEHFSRIIFSGLYDVVEGIYCFILGSADSDIKEARMLFERFGRKVVIAGTSTNTTHYERFTLLGIRAYLQPGDVFLYMHTKGLKYSPTDYNIYDWSFYMMYFVVRQHAVCLRLLSRDFDVCGVDFHTEVSPHFSGNFFWANADYYLTLPDHIGTAYLDPEMYVASGSPRHAALWEANSNFYDFEYPPLRYVDSAQIALAWQGKG